MTRTKLVSLLQLVKALRKVENPMECHPTLERVVAQRAKEKCTKDSDFNPSVVNSESLVDTVIGVGESATRKPSDGFSRTCQVRRREFLMGVRSQRALMKILISQRERCFSTLDVEMIDQLLSLEVLCPRAQWIMRREFRQRKPITA